MCFAAAPPWADYGPVSWTGRAPGKSADFPGVVGNPLPLVRFRRKDRFSTPLVEKRPAPSTPWSERFNFIFWKKIFTFSPKGTKSQSFNATLQSLPTAQQLHFALQTTPLTPEMSQEPTAVAGGGDLLHFDFRDPRRPPPRTCTSRTLVRTLCQGPAQNVTP